jgi:hypothetical protein
VVVSDPDGEPAQAYRAIAARVGESLAQIAALGRRPPPRIVIE